jgi:hypothetical protein
MMKLTEHGVKERHRAKDERELLFCMKVSLDLLMKLNVKDPEVVGFLARGSVSRSICVTDAILLCNVLTCALLFCVDSRYEIFTLKIQHEALYFPRLLGTMDIPSNNTNFECLAEGLPVMFAALVCFYRFVFFHYGAYPRSINH